MSNNGLITLPSVHSVKDTIDSPALFNPNAVTLFSAPTKGLCT
jgi:hypothetical protein